METNNYTDSIRKYRDKIRYSQEYMAHQLGIKQSAYSDIENGKVKMKIEVMERIAEILEVSLFELLGKTDISIGEGGLTKHERLMWEELYKSKIETIEAQKQLIEILMKK
jgi:transcriptional regulator with XRE-family HTH domain